MRQMSNKVLNLHSYKSRYLKATCTSQSATNCVHNRTSGRVSTCQRVTNTAPPSANWDAGREQFALLYSARLWLTRGGVCVVTEQVHCVGSHLTCIRDEGIQNSNRQETSVATSVISSRKRWLKYTFQHHKMSLVCDGAFELCARGNGVQ
jgi:hypothetical protein